MGESLAEEKTYRERSKVDGNLHRKKHTGNDI